MQETLVVDKWIDYGRYGYACHYMFTVRMQDGKEMDLPVSPSVYHSVPQGQTYSVILHRGGLGIPYVK